MLKLTAVAGSVWNTVEALGQGNWAGALMGVANAAVMGLSYLGSCKLPSVLKWMSSTAGEVGMRGLGVIGAIGSIGNAMDRFSSGDVLGGVLDLAQAGADLYMVGKFGKSCFTARMRIKVRGAKKLAMDVQEGDEVAMRNEFDPHGPVVYREVEEVHVRVAAYLEPGGGGADYRDDGGTPVLRGRPGLDPGSDVAHWRSLEHRGGSVGAGARGGRQRQSGNGLQLADCGTSYVLCECDGGRGFDLVHNADGQYVVARAKLLQEPAKAYPLKGMWHLNDHCREWGAVSIPICRCGLARNRRASSLVVEQKFLFKAG